jgi:pimeloyl-ACP methyl ester carboxylesterase
MYRIESLLSSRLFLQPQLIGRRIYFLSNLSGRLSLYAMDYGGSVPEPLLPPAISLQNPELLDGYSFYVFPQIGKILVMIDQDGDENYQPMIIPIEGGFPEPAFGDKFANDRVHLEACDSRANAAYLVAESRHEERLATYQAMLGTGELTLVAASQFGYSIAAFASHHQRAALVEGYSVGDQVIFEWDKSTGEKRRLYGVPLDQRTEGQEIPLLGIKAVAYTPDEKGLLLSTALFKDTYSLAYLDLAQPGQMREVEITGLIHSGTGEFEKVEHLDSDRYALSYNIDGCSWAYEGKFDPHALRMRLEYPIIGQGKLSNGKLEAMHYDESSDRFAAAFCTATSPTQIVTLEGHDRSSVVVHTRERILGIPEDLLSPGEDASFTSFDGTRVSARLYLPAQELGYRAPRPLVYYSHGGPQSQERPDFAWFSMPLIQFLTLNGMAVFVPNVRGSTGYGLGYTKQVDRDWGGKDRLDHVYAMQEILPKDNRLDVSRTGVVGRSYGGYMTLTLAGRHPELWSAAVDMFGPYDLLTFSDRIPVTWRPYFVLALGDPVKDREFLIERSPRTYLDQIRCPLLVIQGRNDPRVVEPESRDVVEHLRSIGKSVDYLVFENEGHDVLKYENRLTVYNKITDFFKQHLNP